MKRTRTRRRWKKSCSSFWKEIFSIIRVSHPRSRRHLVCMFNLSFIKDIVQTETLYEFWCTPSRRAYISFIQFIEQIRFKHFSIRRFFFLPFFCCCCFHRSRLVFNRYLFGVVSFFSYFFYLLAPSSLWHFVCSFLVMSLCYTFWLLFTLFLSFWEFL